MNLLTHTHLHFIGIGGAGMSGVARYALEAGWRVSGSDLHDGPRLRLLAGLGADIICRHDAANVDGADVVVVSSAVPDDNIELVAAREAGLQILRRGELLAEIVAGHPGGIAVCGTHGKGTTAGALVEMLERAGHRVGYVLGAPLRSSGRRAVFASESEFLVAEVDESDRTHLSHRPAHLLINNLEADHLNVYASLDDIVDSFETLVRDFRARRPQGSLVLGLYGEGVDKLRARFDASGLRVTTCGVYQAAAAAADVAADVTARALTLADDGSTRFELFEGHRCLGHVTGALCGELNARNLVSAAAMALSLGVAPGVIAAAAASYTGLVDRFDEIALSGDRRVITDYTSHPTCIAGNLSTLRTRSAGRVHAVFQPFRYSLLAYHWGAYIEALSGADAVYLAPLDAGGEPPIEGIGCAELAGAIGESVQVFCEESLESLERRAGGALGPGDSLIVFGGGPLFDMARRIAEQIDGRPTPPLVDGFDAPPVPSLHVGDV